MWGRARSSTWRRCRPSTPACTSRRSSTAPTKLRRIWHIDLPLLLPTVIILLILRCGHLLSVGFEKVYLMQNPLTIRTSEVLATYVYRAGIEQGRIELGVAVGLFNAVANFAMLVLVNRIARKFSDTSVF